MLFATTPESLKMTDEVSSPLFRHLGAIKAMAIIMGFLIVAVLALIIVTIYGRLNTESAAKAVLQSKLVLPAGSHVIDASLGDKGQILLLILDKSGQQIWQLDRTGRVERKTLIVQKH